MRLGFAVKICFALARHGHKWCHIHTRRVLLFFLKWTVAGSVRLGRSAVGRSILDNQHRCGVICVLVGKLLVELNLVVGPICFPAWVLFG
jgi:hypothetical protein